MKYQFIQIHLHSYPVRAMCRVLAVSPSGYYAARARPPSSSSDRQTSLTSQILAIHVASRHTYGAPRIHAELCARGIPCCLNTVAKLMRQASIMPKAIRRFRVTTDSRNTEASPNLLNRVFEADRPNTRWLSDITYIPTREGWLYLAVILARSRRLGGGQDARLPSCHGCAEHGHPATTIRSSHLALGSRIDLRGSRVSSAPATVFDQPEHEPQRKLLGQCPDGKLLPHAQD